MNSHGISCRISKVNEQLQKLSSLIQNDHNFYHKAKQALQQFHQQESSQDSFNYFQIENQLAASRGFNHAKIEVVSNFSEEQQSQLHGSTAKSGLSGISGLRQSKMIVPPGQQIVMRENNEYRGADITVKKFRPVQDQNKKKKQSQQKSKQRSKLKNSKSQNKLGPSNINNSYKNQSFKKQNKKQIKIPTNQYQLNNNFKGLYKKTKTTNNIKTTSQNRLNQSLKMNMHINLGLGLDLNSNFKKQVNMKITDLNIQKIQCQKEAQYLKSVMKVEQQEKLQAVIKAIQQSTQQSAIYVFMGRLLVNFFSQFFHQKIVISQECTCQQLENILLKKNYLIKYMLKLPDILKKDNTLCQQRCKRLFEQKHFIDHRIQTSHKNLQIDILYQCVDSLHDYISFLINNNVVHQTKRKMLPIEFHSERSARNAHKNSHMYGNVGGSAAYTTNLNTNSGLTGIMLQNATIVKQRQYDSDRKCRKQSSKSKSNHPQPIHNPTVHTYITQNHHKSININNGSKSTLKRTNTKKILSPKPKPKNNPKLSRNINTSHKEK